MRAAVVAAILLVAGWVAIENVGLARFLPAPASQLSSVVSHDAWPTDAGGPSRDGVAQASGPIRGELSWDADLGAPPSGGPVIADGKVFIGTTDGRMHARFLSDSTKVWTRDLRAPLSSTPTLAGEFVFVGLLDGRVVGMAAETGSVVWEFQTGQAVRSSPAVVNGVLYVGSSDRRLYALDALTGKERWSFATGGRITSAPSVNERQVVVTSQDNHVHFIDLRTAKRRFDYEISLTNGSAAIAGDSVFVTDLGGRIRRIRWDERELPFEKAIRNVRRWMFRWGMADELPPQKGVVWVTQQPRTSFVGTPAVNASAVYASTASGALLAYDRATGVEMWRVPVASPALAPPVVISGQVLVGDASGALSAVDGSTGEVVWRSVIDGAITEGIAAGGGMLALATEEGRLYAFR